MKTINLEQLDILFKNKPDNINVFLGKIGILIYS